MNTRKILTHTIFFLAGCLIGHRAGVLDAMDACTQVIMEGLK